MNKRNMQWLLVLVLAVGLVACGGRTKVDSNLRIKGAPDWVNKGTQVVSDKKGRLIHGVGIAPAMGDISLQRSAADTRARAEIARILSTFVNETLRDYSAASGQLQDASIERNIEAETTKLLSGAKVMGRWKNKKTGDIYTFAELDTKGLDQLIQSSKKLDDGFKTFYRQRLSDFSKEMK